MRRINAIYIVAIILSVLLYILYSNIQSDAAFFYGFAENKETEISHDSDVFIHEILVTTGQKVDKGDLIMIVKNTILPVKINELELEKKVITANSLKDIQTEKNRIADLRFEKINKLNELSSRINLLNKEIALNKDLYEGLQSLKRIQDTTKSSREIQVEYLLQRMTTIVRDYDREISFHEKALKTISFPSKLKSEILNTKITHLKHEEEKLSIYAPSDGLIGTILCKEKENISSFKTLLNFYQVNPTLVKGFVHESLLLQVEVGNNLEVSSSMHSQHKVIGKVIGLGSRIVEIPERLRKIPEIKSYGREILISISSDNKFLQKEKVMLNTVLN